MENSKPGPRAQLLDLEEIKMYRPRVFKQKKKIPLEYKMLIAALILTAIILPLDWIGVLDSMLGI